MLKKSVLALALAASLAFGANWNIDKSHSDVGFSVSYMSVSNTKGQFGDYSGSIVWDAKDVSKSKFDVTIQVASINTRDEKRDEHLRGEDFFEVAKFPTIRFVSTKVVATGKNAYAVTGQLTMKGVTKTVTIPFKTTSEVKDPWGNTKMGFEGSFALNRKDYGVSWSKLLDNGGAVVGDEVKISLDVTAIQAK
jgi:polyisoprenoid-binding protein YceI